MLQIRAVISPAGWCSPHSVSPVNASVCLHNNGEKMDEFVSHIVKVIIIDTVMCRLLCVQESCRIAKGSRRELSAQHLSCWFVFHPSIQSIAQEGSYYPQVL